MISESILSDLSFGIILNSESIERVERELSRKISKELQRDKASKQR